MNKIENVMIIFGGNSPEHEVSLRSAAAIYRNIDRRLFHPIPVGMTRDGRFYRVAPPADGADFVLSPETCLGDPLSFTPGDPVRIGNDEIDFVFPIAHGAYGEDGRLQGFLEMLGLPYAGCRTVGSAVCMDKELTKRLCAEAGIPVVPFAVIRSADEPPTAAAASLGYPLAVKPVNAGSSRGVTKVKCESELKAAVEEAFSFDTKVLLEQCIEARELECAVLGNGPFTVFPPGEVVSTHEFYDYDSKYRDSLSTDLRLCADLPEETSALIRNYARKAAEQCEVDGFARIDFFLDKNSGAVYLNEINTLPGFTSGSLFPLMCAENGIPVTDVLTKIIRSGQELSSKRFKFEPLAE